jgi:hypothetical protein
LGRASLRVVVEGSGFAAGEPEIDGFPLVV